MSPFALFFMLLSMGAVSALTLYCFYRILSGRRTMTDPEEVAAAGRPGARGPEAERPQP